MDPYHKYDAFIGQFGKYVCVGQCALFRAGLTTAHMVTLQLGVGTKEIDGLGSWRAKYYYSPWFDKHFETKPSPACPNILVPTQERAVIESMYLHEGFDEGVLIESYKDYLYWHEDLSKIYEVGRKHFSGDYKTVMDYWFQEAREDDSVCGA